MWLYYAHTPKGLVSQGDKMLQYPIFSLFLANHINHTTILYICDLFFQSDFAQSFIQIFPCGSIGIGFGMFSINTAFQAGKAHFTPGM